MGTYDRKLEEIIKAKHDIRYVINEVLNCKEPGKYGENIINYFRQLNEDPRVRYILDTPPLQLFKVYKQKVQDIAQMLNNTEFSEKEKVLNVLEYNRIMSTYENIKVSGFDETQAINTISKYPIFLAIYGKGVCYAQARFIRDILLEMGIEAGDFDIDIYKSDNTYEITGIPHQETLVTLDDENFCIDPTEYNGTLDGIQLNLQPQNMKQLINDGIKIDFEASQSEIQKCRDFVCSKLIKQFEIDKISDELGLQEQENLQKQCTIMAFVESRLNLKKDLHTQIVSAKLNDANIEVGKIIELFFRQNNIEHSLQCIRKNRKNTIYMTKFGESEVCLCPALLYSDNIDSPGIQMRGTHYLKDSNILMYSLNKKMNNTYNILLHNGRKNVLNLIVKDICKANNIEISEFIKMPIETIKEFTSGFCIDFDIMTEVIEEKKAEVKDEKLTSQNIISEISRIGTRNGMNEAMTKAFQLQKGEKINTYRSQMEIDLEGK